MTILRTVYQAGHVFIKYVNSRQIHVVSNNNCKTYEFKNDKIRRIFFSKLKKMPDARPVMTRNDDAYDMEKSVIMDVAGNEFEIQVNSHVQLLMPDDIIIVSRRSCPESYFYGFVTNIIDDVFSKKILASSSDGNELMICLTLADDDSVIGVKFHYL